MAIDATTFSPKEFRVWIKQESVNSGTSALATTGMYQLDVDSVGFPSLNVNQVLDVRTGAGRTLKSQDFFQDNTMRVVELSISGTLHNDAGHNLLLQNITNNTSDPIILASGYTPPDIAYNPSSPDTSGKTFTIVISPPDHTDGNTIEMFGCVCTSFNFSADTGTEGGRYKFNATVKTGLKPDLAEDTSLAGDNAYANTTDMFLSGASVKQIKGADVVMDSFGVTIENDAVFSGFSTSGYEVVNRVSEAMVTAEAVVKYDANTKAFAHDFNTQSAPFASAFTLTNTAKYGVLITNGVFTDVSYNEGDYMQVNVALKSVDNGSDSLIAVDIA